MGQCSPGEAEADPDCDPVAGLDAFTGLMKACERPLSDQQALPDADAGRPNEIPLRMPIFEPLALGKIDRSFQVSSRRTHDQRSETFPEVILRRGHGTISAPLNCDSAATR
jgi:hypothetical protein